MSNHELMELFHAIYKLKITKRSGWVRCGIRSSESVADHIMRTAFIAMNIGDSLNLNTEKMLKMSLLHDLAEIITGDITPYDTEDIQDKRNKERAAIVKLLAEIPNGQEYISLWNEYDKQLSSEAKLIRNIDKLEMSIQALEYQREYPSLDLNEFINDSKQYIDNPKVIELFNIIKKDFTELSG
jgi:5'-deoxynucleotidase YfbR-like HD superfamily hydrolase